MQISVKREPIQMLLKTLRTLSIHYFIIALNSLGQDHLDAGSTLGLNPIQAVSTKYQ